MATIVDDVNETAQAPTAIQRAQDKLTQAVLSGSDRRIKKAQADLEQATIAEARQLDRERALAEATQRAAQLRRDEERRDREAKAHQIEAEVRAVEPSVTFTLTDGRKITIKLAGRDMIDRTTAQEATRRLAWAATNKHHERVVASRNSGAVVPETDWLTPVLGASDGLLHAVRRDLVTVTESTRTTK